MKGILAENSQVHVTELKKWEKNKGSVKPDTVKRNPTNGQR